MLASRRNPKKESSQLTESRNRTYVVELAVCVIIIGSSGAFQVFVPQQAASVFALSPLVVGSGIMILFSLTPGIKFFRQKFMTLPLILLLAVPLASSFWSVNAAKTVNACMILILFAVLARTMAKNLSLEQRIRILSTIFGLLIVFSAVTALLLPAFGIDHDSRAIAWRGIFQNKNSFGRVAAIEFLLSMFFVISVERKRKYGWMAIALLCAVVMVKSDSQTALVAAVAAATITVTSWKLEWKASSGRFLSLCFLGVYVFLSITIPVVGPLIAEFVSRDPTLTGRTILWSFSDLYANLHPVFGWGFGTVWQTAGGVGDLISSHLTFVSASAHNGLLDLRLQIGFIGLAFVLAGLFYITQRGFRSHSSANYIHWLIGYVTLYFAMDLTESTLFFGLTWFLLWLIISPESDNQRNQT